MNVVIVYDSENETTKEWATKFRDLCLFEYDYSMTIFSMADYRTLTGAVIFLYCTNKEKFVSFTEEHIKDRYIGRSTTTISERLLDISFEDSPVYVMENELRATVIYGIWEEPMKDLWEYNVPTFIGAKPMLNAEEMVHKKVVKNIFHFGFTPEFVFRETGYYTVKCVAVCIKKE